MNEEQNLQDWVPELSEELSLAHVIDLAFDYRGDVTVVKHDGSEAVGYLFNRNANGTTPAISLMAPGGVEQPLSIPYADIANVKFTGRDTAAGKSYAAYQDSKQKEQASNAGSDQ
jgi:hypothetical protein